jgi:NADH:ubiquinone oxidoreductase subunit H
MRFGFFFFAEYVNVFILSALTVVLFLGGWNAPFEIDPLLEWIGGVLPGLGIATPVTIALDPGGLGLPLLFLLLLVPPIGTLLLAAPFYLLRSSMRWWVALIVGFLLFNVVAGGLLMAWAYVSFEWVAGLLWFLGKTFVFVFVFVWMRGTLPRVRIDQLMGFAWKWLLPAALLNLFVTAFAVVLVGS